jgi:tetratricopeptide (TPR) repeat protein
MTGSKDYLLRRYKEAIASYQKGLELEKKERQERRLDKTSWRVLVDNLGMAYGVTGDLKHAKETFEYGLSEDPRYPMFYYNMACTYAETNDLASTLTYLKKAFEYKANAIPGEGMPDPRKDDSFQRFMKNPEFRKLVDSLAGPSN